MESLEANTVHPINITVRNPLLLCPLVSAQDGGTRSRQKCLHRDFSATVLFWVIMLGEAIFDIKHDFFGSGCDS